MQTRDQLLNRIKKHREEVDKLKPTMGHPARVEVMDIKVSLADQHTLPIAIYRSYDLAKEAAPYPTLFYIPGSGFTTLNAFFPYVTGSQLAEKSHCQVVVINHRLAPEHPFPQSLLDVYEVLHILFKNAKALQIDKMNSILVGECSGGNLAINVIKLFDFNKDKIHFKHLFLISPYVDFSESLRQRPDEDKDQCISEHFLNAMKRYYVQDFKELRNPLLSPYWHVHFKELPSTDIVTGEYDRTRGNSFFFFKKLVRTGASATLSILKKNDHRFMWHNICFFEKMAQKSRAVLNREPVPRSVILKENKDEHSNREPFLKTRSYLK